VLFHRRGPDAHRWRLRSQRVADVMCSKPRKERAAKQPPTSVGKLHLPDMQPCVEGKAVRSASAGAVGKNRNADILLPCIDVDG